jgi:DNA polymerase III delta prime subunit
MANSDEVVWSQKYRPQTVEDCILPKQVKEQFLQFAKNGNVPNLLLSGKPGMGKTTLAMALLNDLGSDYIMINGSLNNGIDTLRNQIADYAASMSFSEGRKFVLFDEADYLNGQSVQPALRGFIEEFSENTGFIFTCNNPKRLTDALHSRCVQIDFTIPKAERLQLMKDFINRAMFILRSEKIEFDPKVVAALIKERFPDFRKVINNLQRYSASGKIDTGVLVSFENAEIEELAGYIKGKEFKKMREWVAEHADQDFTSFIDKLYNYLYDRVEPRCIAPMILTFNKYDYQDAFVSSKEINTTAMLVELLVDLNFKQ